MSSSFGTSSDSDGPPYADAPADFDTSYRRSEDNKGKGKAKKW